MTIMKILVTGGTGFVGSYLVDALIKRNYTVRCLVRQTSNTTFLKKIGAELIYGDITDKKSLEKSVENIDVIFHLAAIKENFFIDKKIFWDVNFNSTKNLLDICHKKKIKRFIFCSTILVTGYPNRLPIDEKFPYEFHDLYQKTKGECEKLILKYFYEKGVPITIIRPAIVYGIGKCFVVDLARMIRNKKFVFLGNGNNKIHLVHIKNLIKSFILTIKKKDSIGQIYIIADEKPTKLKNLIKTISKTLGIKVRKIFIPVTVAEILGSILNYIYSILLKLKIKKLDKNYIKPRTVVDLLSNNYFYDISKAKKELGYKPKMIKNEIKNIVEYSIRNNYL